jgi:DNA-binding NarL/FixJ family response regulator
MPRDAEQLIVVIDQQRLLRETMCEALDAQPHLRCRSVEGLVDWPADLLVGGVETIVLASHDAGTDLVDAVRTIGTCAAKPRIVAIAGYVDRGLAADLVEAGADEVLSTDASMGEVIDAIHRGGEGRTRLSEDRDGRAADRAGEHSITPRQHEVLRLLAAGLTPKQIARQLDIAVGTCRDHIKALRRALDCASSTELVVSAFQLGLLPELHRPALAGPPSER